MCIIWKYFSTGTVLLYIINLCICKLNFPLPFIDVGSYFSHWLPKAKCLNNLKVSLTNWPPFQKSCVSATTVAEKSDHLFRCLNTNFSAYIQVSKTAYFYFKDHWLHWTPYMSKESKVGPTTYNGLQTYESSSAHCPIFSKKYNTFRYQTSIFHSLEKW